MASLWFPSQNIPDAIAESRRLSRLFVVYITGDDDASRRMDEMWQDERVVSFCKMTCIAIKLRADSDGCKQFSAIYPVLTIPSAYFIDSTGKIVEALASQLEIDEFLSKIDIVTKPYRTTEGTIVAQQNEEKSESSKPEEIPESGAGASTEKEAKGHEEKKPERRRKTLEERVEDEVKDETSHEKERREWGKNMQKLKEAQREAKLKQNLEERKREKLEEQAAKERVRRQIEQDKLDRAARFREEKNERIQSAAHAQLEKAEAEKRQRDQHQREKNLHARLQFRLPDGSTLVETFESADILQSAADFIVRQNFSNFTSIQSFELAMAFPRKSFPFSDYSKTFTDLGLAPSASLVVLPRQAVNASPSDSTSSGVWSLLLSILMIPGRILMFLWSFVSGQSGSQQAVAVHSAEMSSDAPQSRSGTGDTANVRQRRNMTRLRDVKGDDDDTATWNGNSTQQM